jgi:hypothetical protein
MSSGVSSSSLPDGKIPALVQTAVPLDGGVDRATTIFGIGHVGGQPADSPGVLSEAGHRGVQVGLVARGHQHVDARGRECLGDSAADALAAAGDDGGPALE